MYCFYACRQDSTFSFIFLSQTRSRHLDFYDDGINVGSALQKHSKCLYYFSSILTKSLQHLLFPFYREKAQATLASLKSYKASDECTILRPELSDGVCDELSVQYWEGLGVDEQLPNLSITSTSNDISSECMNISGRRIVSVTHFIKAIQELGHHRCTSPHGGCFEFQTERRVGFWSEYTFKCNGCAENRKVTTDPVAEPTPLTDKTALGVNDAAVWGFMSIGSGHSHLEEAMSVMEIPTMSKGAFLRREESIGKVRDSLFYILYS